LHRDPEKPLSRICFGVNKEPLYLPSLCVDHFKGRRGVGTKKMRERRAGAHLILTLCVFSLSWHLDDGYVQWLCAREMRTARLCARISLGRGGI